MRRRALFSVVALGLAMASAPPAQAATDARVTVDDTAGSYQLANGGGTDETMTRCSEGRRQQNEPSIAVDPSNPDVVVAGANDYCAAIVNNEVWSGYYRSEDGGTTWVNSLVPGYPNDTSDAGEASPVHGTCGASGDPTQAFDADGNLFYGFICFNRSKPINGGVYVARYIDHGADYDRTVLVKRGTPSGLFGAGLFQDKINLTTDQTDGEFAGNVYVAWSQYHGVKQGNNAVLFVRSTDHGLSYTRPFKVTPTEQGTASFADLAVGPDGTVYLTYLTYPSSSRPTADVWLLSSTDGGVSFGDPINVASVELFDSNQFSGATGTVDCGDGPFACESGFTFSRFFSNSAVAADEDGVHVVWASELPSGQNKVFVRNSTDGGETFDDAATLDGDVDGHQWFPDIASAEGVLTVIFYDSRSDPAYDPERPPGNNADGTNSGDVVQAFVAQSSDGGETWDEDPVSSAGSNFGWKTHGSRRVGFWGDYLYVSAVRGAVHVVWTDSRDLKSGDDPRDGAVEKDFAVFQPCTYVPNDINAPAYSSPTIADPCLSQGGLDQNIYGARV
ncbi:MAG TPA: sialidase family protein [Actinomycetota bacterium]|nr:sialidase family protein [Actinomycetota bacterium]